MADTELLRLFLPGAGDGTARHAHAGSLARHLGLELTHELPASGELYLTLDDEGLGVRRSGARQKAVRADFLAPALDYRRRFGGGYRQPLARAVGVSGKHKPRVLDMTAGLGRDSFVLASLGCEVTMLERSRVVAALLADGLRRAEAEPRIAGIAARMTLIEGDAIEWLRDHPASPQEVIYVDPMFPARRKSALVKGEMQLLHELVGRDEPVEPLVQAALAQSARRVVVKRPSAAPRSGKPEFSVRGKRNRFDVYVLTHPPQAGQTR